MRTVVLSTKSIQKVRMTASATLTNQLTSRIAAIAVTLMFVVNGAVIGGFGGSLPSLRDKLGLDATQIAIMLFCGGAAAILAMQIGGRLADAIGAREITLAAVPFLIAGMITIGLAPVFGVAIIGGILHRAGQWGDGCCHERHRCPGRGRATAADHELLPCLLVDRSIRRRRCHVAARHPAWLAGWRDRHAHCRSSIAVASTRRRSASFSRSHPRLQSCHHTIDGVKTPIPKAAWILGVMALAFGLSEGTATDWSSLHVTDVAGVDPTTGALGLMTVSAFMVIIRLLGDRLVSRFGRRTVVRFGALFAAIGYLTVTLVSSLPMLVVGWALVGFGVGMIAPQVYAVAGHIGGGRVLAVVVTFGYAAFLLGPAFMGFLVNHVGIHHAMAVPALLCAGIIALASTMPRNDVGLSQR